MNAKQSLKLVVKQNEALTDFNLKATQDIKAYNDLIISVIRGEMSFCDWCEDNNECQRECKGHGCEEWWLAYDLPVKPEEGSEADDSKGILSASPKG